MKEMKDSGIEWIGKIPQSSVIKRIKDISLSLGGGNYGEEEGSEGYLMPCISISDFKNGDLCDNLNIKISRIYKKKNKLKKGTILIEKSGGGEKNPVGRSIYLINDIESYYTNFVQGIKIVKEHPKYINYCLKIIHNYRLHMHYVKQTTGLQNFEFNKFSNNFYLPIHNITEQEKIANYLDIETAKIDKKISILEQKIEKLEEYKQSVIFETVTKGLDKNVEMKDSGIEWIGQIDKNINLVRLKSIYDYKNGYSFSEIDYSPVLNYKYLIKITNITESGIIKDDSFCINLNKKNKNFKIKNNSILYALSGATAGKSCYLGNTEDELYLNQRVAQIKLKKGLNKYLYYIISNKVFSNLLLNLYPQTAQPNINKEHIDNAIIPFYFDNVKQKEIVKFLDDFTFKIENKIKLIKKQIELLKEYKEAIIYEAVTGKMEIL